MIFTRSDPFGFHIEIIPPKQDSQKLEEDLDLFASKFERVMESGFTASITDNAMGLLAFQGHECIEELGLRARPDQILIHLNTFHTKQISTTYSNHAKSWESIRFLRSAGTALPGCRS